MVKSEALQAAGDRVTFVKRYTPAPTAETKKKYRRFCALYDAALKISEI